jgi:hypothetical protein
MPIFMDRHDMKGATAENVAEAHRKDLAIDDLIHKGVKQIFSIAGEAMTPHPARLTIIAFGSSSTEGIGASTPAREPALTIAAAKGT